MFFLINKSKACWLLFAVPVPTTLNHWLLLQRDYWWLNLVRNRVDSRWTLVNFQNLTLVSCSLSARNILLHWKSMCWFFLHFRFTECPRSDLGVVKPCASHYAWQDKMRRRTKRDPLLGTTHTHTENSELSFESFWSRDFRWLIHKVWSKMTIIYYHHSRAVGNSLK